MADIIDLEAEPVREQQIHREKIRVTFCCVLVSHNDQGNYKMLKRG